MRSYPTPRQSFCDHSLSSFDIITARNEVEKVIFSEACVKNSVHGGGGSPGPGPGGRLVGLAGGGLQAHIQGEVGGLAGGGSPGPHPGATAAATAAADCTHLTGMHSC